MTFWVYVMNVEFRSRHSHNIKNVNVFLYLKIQKKVVVVIRRWEDQWFGIYRQCKKQEIDQIIETYSST